MATDASGTKEGVATMERPLTGVRVLDLTMFLAGPFCTMILGDLGADVIKIEPPGGESQRNAMKLDSGEPDPPSFLNLNRNKRGLVINLKSDAGRDLIHELVAQSDILVENYRPGVTAKLGIDYETLSAIRPELIYASITGFGDTGPYAQRPGLDLITQGMSGIMSVTGARGGEPAKAGVAVTDLSSGMFGAIAVLGAYVSRISGGEGQFVTSSLFEAGVSLGIHESAELWGHGKIPGPLGSGHRFAAPYQALRAKDGYLTVGPGTQSLWERFCEAVGRPELVEDERFIDNGARMKSLDALEEELEKALAEDTVEAWVEKIIAAGVPAGPILNYEQVLSDPHTQAREMVTEVDHPQAGRIKNLGSPFKLTGTEKVPPRPSPLLGEHSDEILAEFGIGGERIASLRASGAIA